MTLQSLDLLMKDHRFSSMKTLNPTGKVLLEEAQWVLNNIPINK